MPLDHACIPVPAAKLEDEVKFMTSALAHMKYTEMARYPNVVGLGDVAAFYWLFATSIDGTPIEESQMQNVRHHMAFKAENHDQVDVFYKVALEVGGKDNGPPGERVYQPGYYAAFVISPAGNNIEVVNRPAPAAKS